MTITELGAIGELVGGSPSLRSLRTQSLESTQITR